MEYEIRSVAEKGERPVEERDEEFLERRNRENLVEMYREELLRIIGGEKCVDLLPRSVRMKMKNDGVLGKHGALYTVTDLGMEMLGEKER